MLLNQIDYFNCINVSVRVCIKKLNHFELNKYVVDTKNKIFVLNLNYVNIL